MIHNKLLLTVIILCIHLSFSTAQQKYQQAWDALNHNDYAKASQYVQEAMKDKATFADNFITDIYLKTYNGKEDQVKNFEQAFYNTVENPYPYIYALWFNQAVLGDYGKKQEAHQLKILDKIISDPRAHGTLVAAAHYQKGLHYMFSNDFANAQKEYVQVGNIKNWQYVGPFENLSRSGFYKEYGPLAHPEANAEFISSTNAKVKWFSPSREIQDGWTPVCFQFNKRTGVVYAQTFIDSPKEQEVLCNAGASGALKIWLNDNLIFSDYTERVTEMDTYTVKCKLEKGVNRFLIQLSFTDADYPNFGIRVTDEHFRAIPSLNGSSIYKPYAKASSSEQVVPIRHFAEAFFEDKISKEPDNYVNRLLLADVYLRNKKTFEARTLMESVLQKQPHNNLLRLKLIQVLLKENNRSLLLEEVAKLKNDDPESHVALDLSIRNDFDSERFDEAEEKLKRFEELYGENMTSIEYKLSILIQEKKFNEFVATAEKAYKKYPNSTFLLPVMHSIRKEVYKDPSGGLKLYENYLKDNFNFKVVKRYAELLREQGETGKSLDQKLFLVKNFSYDPSQYAEMANYYFTAKQYPKAEEYIREALKLSPYHERYWDQLGDIKREKNDITAAIDAYHQSLMYDPNQYEVINKLRKLQGKTETYKLVSDIDVDKIIAQDNPASALNTELGYYVIHDEQNVIMHEGGATEEYDTYIVRITNEKGIQEFKESTIGYGSAQTLLIQQSDVVKKSGSRIRGERNENQIVFTNLEAGDVVVFKYRIQNYIYGRFAKEYWNKRFFGSTVYTAFSRYTLLLPANQKINYLMTNSALKPVIKDVEDYKQYSWEVSKVAGMKEEPYMPEFVDVAPVLHLSTLSSWQDIGQWYADIINHAGEEGYEVKSLFNTLLPEDERNKLSQFEKAKRMYEYIQKNIRYSSVSFRQSAYVPQRASITLSTRLGDCKDLSNLFMILCKMADIECKMVLVDTRDNGTKDLMLPSIDFNHCIAKAKLDGKDYYIELTDNYLPFASLPNNLLNAQILEIPKTNEIADLKSLVTSTKTKEIARRKITIKPSGSDLQISTTAVRTGNLSADTRAKYANLDYQRRFSQIEESVASSYKNNVEMDTVMFYDIDNLSDSVHYAYSYRVKDEVIEIGSMNTFKITYPDVVASLSYFASPTRTYPVNYNNYEDTDQYDTFVTIEVPAGKKFVEVPANEVFTFKNMSYSIQYKQVAPEKLQVRRKFVSDRNMIPASDYNGFKSFIEKIVKAEQKMIAFK
jgi:tetratricopeptide (TPR) repeat protein